MIVLSFDTTSSRGGAGLYRSAEGELEPLGESSAEGPTSYSVQLFEMTDRLLAGSGLKLANVDLFAVATGPGSFTGIRVGLAAAEAWAYALRRPVCGISLLEAMVVRARRKGGIAVPLLDAHRGEFYLGVFGDRRQAVGDELPHGDAMGSGGGFALTLAGVAALARKLMAESADGVTFIVCEHDQAGRDLCTGLTGQFPEATQSIIVPSYQVAAIALCAWEAAREGREQRPDDLRAFYVRQSDAELKWQE
jgi:tRNA threonylcarbamoyladenosine biosynthesis protein TsaB